MDEQFNTELCRCCLTDGSYKNLTETFQWMGEDEVYGDMLKDCFDVMICDSSIGGICDVCITQLRNASNFKKQVLQSEQKFKKKLEISLKGDTVKIEHVCENDQDSDTIDQDSYFEVLEAEMEVPIKEEVAIETKSRKRGMKLVKNETKAKRSKQDPETSTKGNLRKRKPDQQRGNRGRTTPEDLAKRTHNLLTVLEFSNATPFKNKSGSGFHCVYCTEIISDPGDLKMHTLRVHEKVKLKYRTLKTILYANNVKLDITSLQCAVCAIRLETLPDLFNHLNRQHDKKFHTNFKDRILPFKFDEADVSKCVICFESFVNFNMLQRHMNVHYRNHICEICDSGFVAEPLLRAHMTQSHGQGEYRCSLCEKVFATKTKKNDHEKAVHHGYKRNKCPHCPERFMCYRKRNAHITKVHDKPRVVYKCHSCDRSFNLSYQLSRHVKKDHLMERKFACQECDMKFFTNKCLENHMVKHTGERNYVCSFCLKSFGRKRTLREHMRIHNNDRRFRCEECLRAFVQKCAWRSHMRIKHDVTV